MSEGIVAAIIDALGAIVAAFIGAIIAIIGTKIKRRRSPSKALEPQAPAQHTSFHFMGAYDNPCKRIGSVSIIRMFSVNSHVLYNTIAPYLAKKPNIVIEEIILVVRRKPNESENDLNILYQLIKNWHRLVEKRRIHYMRIIGIPYDLNHYYTLIGTELAYSGMVYYDNDLPTHTDVDYTPLVITGETETGEQLIENYRKHFDRTVEAFKDTHTLYDSTNPQMYLSNLPS